jgi:hypothetical protein
VHLAEWDLAKEVAQQRAEPLVALRLGPPRW